MSANYRTLAPAVAGVYAVQFADHVKIGMTRQMRGRIRGHGKDGGFIARVWIATDRQPLEAVEEDALTAATLVGRRVRKTEMFTGITFGQACDILRSVTARHWGGPVHERDGFTAEVVTPIPNPRTLLRHGWDGAYLVAAS